MNSIKCIQERENRLNQFCDTGGQNVASESTISIEYVFSGQSLSLIKSRLRIITRGVQKDGTNTYSSSAYIPW